MTDYTQMRKRIVAAAADARWAIDMVERAVLRIDRKQPLFEQSRAVCDADEAICTASDMFEAFYAKADDLMTIAEKCDD